VRSALLTSARDLFLQYGFRAVSARQVASRAGVDPAMVQYYFASKRGLYLAMIDGVVAPLRELVEGMNLASDRPADLATFLELYMRVAAANPWVPALLIREVLPAEGELRRDVVGRVIRPMAGALRQAIVRAQADGRLDPSLRPEFVLITVLSLAMWPFLVRPLVEPVLGIAFEGDRLDALIAHARGVLERGTGARA
jgi:AcrR family transcriptional regulator